MRKRTECPADCAPDPTSCNRPRDAGGTDVALLPGRAREQVEAWGADWETSISEGAVPGSFRHAPNMGTVRLRHPVASYPTVRG